MKRTVTAIAAGLALAAGLITVQVGADAATTGVEVNGVRYNFGKAKWSLDEKFKKTEVSLPSSEAPGTIIINTRQKYLYLILGNGRALRYGVGVGREGFKWQGTENITRKAEWPEWIPPAEMREREPDLPERMPGGPDNPLGARALYLGASLYRIHGTAQPWTIGTAVSSGCIRLQNEDVIDLYERVPVGAKVIVQ